MLSEAKHLLAAAAASMPAGRRWQMEIVGD
jgi:hypothetical protein